MVANLITLVVGVSIAAFFLWTNNNGIKRDRERAWGKRD
ncbi:hypothetical protein OKW35_000200 [Paraburkholderia sp. MM5477-R1]|uniref:Uncharacterized protein n=1 Tax=Paraburkholderia tuberum TaxID=157910 RepID=A0A1H1KKI4_9BURK|nr:hypothetical protein SAMN05445850_8482 [Paraburkholderia tuberum]